MRRKDLLALCILPFFTMGIDACEPSDPDVDGDGYTASEDCNDEDATVNPGAEEICNSQDDDCDGVIDEETCNGAVTWTYRDSLVEIFGEDNGRAEGPYGDDVGTNELGDFAARLGDELEHVSSVAAQESTVQRRSLSAYLTSRSSGQDNSGYAEGMAYANSDFLVEFDLEEAAWVTLQATVTVDEGRDGGSVYSAVSLSMDGTTLFAIDGDGSQGTRRLLEAGSYELRAYANTQVVLSGGGDAYPSGGATVELTMDLPQ